MARPLVASLVVALSALLLERILRLVDLIAAQGGPLGPVMQMALNLVPHYLGLALPAAFFISMFVVVARLADDSELDAILTIGQPVRRMAAPFILTGVLFAVVSIALYGFIQPYSRYAYRAVYNMVKYTGWSGDLPQGVFVNAGDGMTVFAETVDMTGTRMTQMFIHQQNAKSDVITTAERGELNFNDDRSQLRLTLMNGRQIRTEGSHTAVIEFDRYTFTRDFLQQAYLFRPRGADERELTLVELYQGIQHADSKLPVETLRAEFHGRLARAASIIFLPLLALPMGLAAKRGRRGPGLLAASIILLLYHHALQFGEGLADLGRAGPLEAIWGPFAIFAAFCLTVIWRTDLKPGIGPFVSTFAAIEATVDMLGRRLPARWRPS